MTDLTTTETPTDVDVLRFLGLDPRDVRAQALVTLARRYGLDPLAGHLVMVDRKPYVTRDGLLHVAHRSGQLDGITLDRGPSLVDGEWRCVVSVYRRDMSRPFTYPGRYPARGGNQKYAPEMAIKVGESMALRRAFDVTGVAALDEVRDELETRGVDVDRPVERHAGRPAGDDPWETAAPAVDPMTGEPLVDEIAGVRRPGTHDGYGDGIGRSTFASVRRALGTERPGDTLDDREPTARQMNACNARLRAAGVVDTDHRGRAIAAALGLDDPVASLRDLNRGQISALLDVDAADLAAIADATLDDAVVIVDDATADDLGIDPDVDPGPLPESDR